MAKTMIKADFDPTKLEQLGYIFSFAEGGYVSSDGATIVNLHRSPYQRQVMQCKANVETEHMANIEQLRYIGALEI